jgi:ribosome-associated protein
VNTSSTRIELSWSVAASGALRETQRARVLERLASRLDATGTLRLVAADTRSQSQNRALAEERLAALVGRALIVPKVRRVSGPPRSADRARLSDKRKASEKKQQRRSRGDDE